MEPRQIEEELKFALQELHREAMAHERFNRNPNEMVGKCDTFEHDWSERLEQSRGQKLHQAEGLATEIAQLREKQSRQHDNALTVAAIEPFDPLTRDLIYNATDRREQERPPNPELLKTVLQPAQDRINQRSDQLLHGMQAAVDAVRSGRDPDISFILPERKPEAKEREDEAAKLKMRPKY